MCICESDPNTTFIDGIFALERLLAFLKKKPPQKHISKHDFKNVKL